MANQDKVLLALLPYWSPLIPPLGLACLKGFLQEHNINVKTVDANIESQFRDVYDTYFGTIQNIVPPKRWGNFYSVGMDVMRNHLMAHLYQSEGDYHGLVRELVFRTFYCDISEDEINSLRDIIEPFFQRLETYITELLYRERPSVLGVSVFSGSLPASVFAFKIAKQKFPQIQTVMGGGIFADDLKPGSPNFDTFVAKTPFIDKMIIGEGEVLFLKLLQGELPPNRKFHDFQDIQGTTFDLKAANLPDFSDFDLDLYPSLAAYASRSCPFQCSFCSETISWGAYRHKGGAQIVRELTELYRRHNYQLFLMGDSLLNPVVNDLSRAFEQSDLSLYWDGYLRVDKPVSRREHTLLWRRGGFYRARLGIESGSHDVLKMMNKMIEPAQIKTGISSLAYAGIKTTTYWVVGHPGETEAHFQETLDLIEEMQDDIWEAECSPFNYYFSGQVHSDIWAKEGKTALLYPEKFNDMLVMPTWVLQVEPSREEIYERMIRFVQHCRKLGIPNPYSMHEIYQADERWKHLHKNAVPALVEFKEKDGYIGENKNIQCMLLATNVHSEQVEWTF